MAQWKSTDNANGAPIWAPTSVRLAPTAANRNLLFDNTTPNAFTHGQTVEVVGIAANEIANSPGVSHTGWNLRKVGTGGRAGRVSYECLVAGGFKVDTQAEIVFQIDHQPVAKTTVGNAAATFSVAAVVAPVAPVTYVWQYYNANAVFANLAANAVYTNVNTASLVLTSTAGLNASVFRVLVISGATTLTSANAVLTVS
jgi:hypothetical protein